MNNTKADTTKINELKMKKLNDISERHLELLEEEEEIWLRAQPKSKFERYLVDQFMKDLGLWCGLKDVVKYFRMGKNTVLEHSPSIISRHFGSFKKYYTPTLLNLARILNPQDEEEEENIRRQQEEKANKLYKEMQMMKMK